MMADLEKLNAQLSRVSAKMEQAVRIFTELRERKQAVLAGSARIPLQDILAREQRVIAICTEGIETADLALAELKKAAAPLKPTKEFTNLWDTLYKNLFVAQSFLKRLSEEQALWVQWQGAAEPERKVILKKIAQSDKEMRGSLKILSGAYKLVSGWKVGAAGYAASASLFAGIALSEPNLQVLSGVCSALFMGMSLFFYKMSQLMEQ